MAVNDLVCPPNRVMFFGNTATFTGSTVTVAMPHVGEGHVGTQAAGLNGEQATTCTDC